MSQSIYSAVVIGLGQIGLGYDYHLTDDSFIFTHCTALTYHPQFKLLAAVDPLNSNREQFKQKYNLPCFENIFDLFKLFSPDIVVISVPTLLHEEVFNSILQLYKPKLILCEKPLSLSLETAKSMIEKARKKNIRLITNYIRRFDKSAQFLKENFTGNYFGDIYKGLIWYSKGLFNNASHFLDLLIYFFGKPTAIQVISCENNPHFHYDPEPNFVVSFGEKNFFFLSTREKNFSLVKMELISDKGIITYKNGGEKIFFKGLIKDPMNSNYTLLSGKDFFIENSLKRYQYNVVDWIAKLLDNPTVNIPCDEESVEETQLALHEIISQLKGNNG